MGKLFTLAIMALALGWLAIGGGSAMASTTLVVDDDSVECPLAGYSTISAAVTAATGGDTIEVCAGTYAETVTIGTGLDNLTLQGDDPATTVINGRILFQTATDLTGVTVQNLTVAGPAYAAIGQGGVGYLYDLVFDNLILDGQNSDNFSMYLGQAAGSFTLTNSEVTGYTDWGNIYIGEATLNAGAAGPSLTTVTFEGNYIHDNAGSNVIYGNTANYTDLFVIRDNVFEENGSHIWSWASIEAVNTANVIAENNVFSRQLGDSAHNAGLYFTQYDFGPINAVVTGNVFSDNVAGVTLFAGDVSGVEIHFNDFSGNDTAVWTHPTYIIGTADATSNWWGDKRGPSRAMGKAKGHDEAKGDKVSPNVRFAPWLRAPVD